MEEKRFGVTALGELLIDFTENGQSGQGNTLFEANPGGVLISFDPNLRPPLWDRLEEARVQISYGLAHCDILKIADNELEFMTGETDFDRGAAMLRECYPNIRLFNVTVGAEGSYSYYEDKRVFVPACKLGGVIETTGAGDTFCVSVLNFVLDRSLDGLTEADLTRMLRFANTAAYLVTTRRGLSVPCPSRSRSRPCWSKRMSTQ